MSIIGKRIKEARKTAGLSQSALSKCINKTLRTVQKYESGEIEPSVSTIKEIAKVLKAPPEYLCGFDSFPLSHIMLCEIGHEVGPYLLEEVLLFNANQISLEEARRYADAGEYNKNVLCIPKNQWISLFRDGKEM